MNEIIIDGSKIKTIDEFHDEIEKISSVSGYGRNLDALHDVLTEMTDTLIIIKYFDALNEKLGDYADKILMVINDANEDNECLSIKFSS